MLVVIFPPRLDLDLRIFKRYEPVLVQGIPIEEAAQVLDLSIAVLKHRLHLARLCLIERLGRYLRDSRAV